MPLSNGKKVISLHLTVGSLFSRSGRMETRNAHLTTEEIACGANQLVTLISQELDHLFAVQGTARCMELLALKTLSTGVILL